MNAIDRIAWLHRIVLSNPKLAALKVAVILADFCNSQTGKSHPGLQARLGRDVTTDGARWLRNNGFVEVMREAFRGEPTEYLLTMPEATDQTTDDGDNSEPEIRSGRYGKKGQEGTANYPPLKGQEGTANSPGRYGKKGQEGTANYRTQPCMNHGMNQEAAGIGQIAVPSAASQMPAPAPVKNDFLETAPEDQPTIQDHQARTLGDWQIMVGKRAYIDRQERDAWDRLLAHAGWEILTEAYRAVEPTITDRKHLVQLAMLVRWIDDHYQEATP